MDDAAYGARKMPRHVQWSEHRLFISRLETDCFALFSVRFIFLEYSDLSNQRNFFLHGSLALRICPIKSIEYATRDCKKIFATRANFFSSMLSFFLCTSVSGLLNNEFMV